MKILASPNCQYALEKKIPIQKIEILGPLRFILAVSVMVHHLTNLEIDAGRHAVIGFFCISGYLITRISATAYRGRPGAFLLNRFLRIYPQYFIALCLGFLVVWFIPEATTGFNPVLRMPVNALEWLKQFFIIGLFHSKVRLVPPTWSLNVEIYFYIIIGLITYRSEITTYVLGFISLIPAVVALIDVSADNDKFYGNPIGNAFVFFLGSVAFFISRRAKPPKWLPWAALVVYSALAWIFPSISEDPLYQDLLLVLSAVMIALILIKIPVIQTQNKKVANVLNFMARVSYPLFLVHWAVSTPLFSRFGDRSPIFFLGSFFCSLIVASFMVLFVDLPIEQLRARIRSRKVRVSS